MNNLQITITHTPTVTTAIERYNNRNEAGRDSWIEMEGH